ncbi:MAG: VWA domain-containing protein [Pseudomonadota bacterium]
MKPTRLRAAALATALLAAAPAAADTSLLFVLDSSGSMWGQVDGTAKISTAKSVLGRLMGDLPANTRAGLMVYGHRSKSACDDVELVAPIGGLADGGAEAALAGITPLGKTPIAQSLARTETAFAGLPESSAKHVVLISDGIETCDGDPCAAAGKLAASGINVRVHVVGFDLSAEDRAQLQCIADNGNGRYFAADSTAGFAEAVAEAVTVASEEVAVPAPPAPEPEPASAILFLDDFDGEALQPHWHVQNPDADAFLVEEGRLLALASGGATLENGDVVNLFRLEQDLPKGDWVATMQFRMPYHTGRETVFFGLYDDKDNHMVGFAGAWSYYENIRGARLFLSGQKVAKGKKTSFGDAIWGGAGGQAFSLLDEPNPFVLRITKKGRSYTPSLRLARGAETIWLERDSMTALRPVGQLAFGIYQAESVRGETPVHVDWIKIERLD